jgi:hypothetical protein
MKKLLLVIVVAVAVGAVWSARRGAAPADAPKRLFADRIWIDHVPRGERDTIQVFAAVSEHAVGVFQAASQWRGRYEVFRYEAHGGELRVVYPQTGERDTVQTKAQRCQENGMDFCLDLVGASRGVKRYYSREGWEIGGAADARAIEDAIEHQLAALRAAPAAE